MEKKEMKLRWAAGGGAVAVVRGLLDEGVNPNSANYVSLLIS